MSDKDVREGMRRDSVNRVARIRRERERQEDGYTGKDKLEFDIGKLESTITNCEWDLNSPELKGNNAIIHKLKTAKEQLIVKKEELKKLMEEKK